MYEEAEKIVIDCLLSSGDVSLFKALHKDDFVSYTDIFSAICRVNSKEKPIDIVTVSEELDTLDWITRISGKYYFDGYDIDYYVNQLKERTEKTKLQKFLTETLGDLSRESKDLSEIKSNIKQRFSILPEKKITLENVKTSTDQIADYKKRIENLKGNILHTGFDKIDQYIPGIAGGEVLTIIARAGAYKTAMLQYILKNYVEDSGNAAIFFSIEMATAAVAERYLAMLMWNFYDVEPAFRDHAGPTTDKAEEKYKEAFKNLFIIDSRISLDDIKPYIQLIEKQHKVKVGTVGVDYLGLVKSEFTKEYDRITDVALNMKHVARDINLPFIMLSQTSRVGGDGSQEVYMDQGKGSGAIEDGSDFVIGNWQNEDLLCKICKNRKGIRNKIFKLDINRQRFLFSGDCNEVIVEKKNTRKAYS